MNGYGSSSKLTFVIFTSNPTIFNKTDENFCFILIDLKEKLLI